VLLFTGAGIAAGLLRAPEYTAEARLAVSTGDSSTSLIGFADTSRTLAIGYSQAVDAPKIVQPAARKLNVSTGTAISRLSASATTDSAVVRVQATGPSKRSAVELANAGAKGLRKYVGGLSDVSTSSKLLNRFQAASLRARRLAAAADAVSNTNAPSTVVEEAASKADTARLQASALKTAYADALTTSGEARLQLLSPATTATSDRIPRLELFVFAGLLGGLALGTALAVLRARSRR
jgi:capsular polysaccharide biosynthesis protein